MGWVMNGSGGGGGEDDAEWWMVVMVKVIRLMVKVVMILMNMYTGVGMREGDSCRVVVELRDGEVKLTDADVDERGSGEL